MKTTKKSIWVIAMLVVSAMCGATALAAEEADQPKPTEQKETRESKPNAQEMQDLTMAMAPALGAMAQNMMDGIYTGLAKPDTAKKLAKFMKNYYEALVAEGFTREEAIQIVQGFAVPSIGR